MNAVLWAGVLLIGGLGSVTRFLVDKAVARRAARSFPLGTFTVNITGALLLGFVTGLGLSHPLTLLAGTAFLGAYTTFSTWMFETQRLAEERQVATALANLALSVLAGLAAAAAGHAIAGAL